MGKIKMPKRRCEFEAVLKAAFHAGVNHAMGIEWTEDTYAQAELGAKNFIGEISDEEMDSLWEKIKEGEQIDL